MDNNLAKNLLEQYGGLDTNDLQNYFNYDEDEENEPQILKQSAYIDLENIEKFIEQNKHNFNALSMNIESANSKFDELITTLQYLKKNLTFYFPPYSFKNVGSKMMTRIPLSILKSLGISY
jgi:NADH/NAD ratio-sensing transcriptional regulator Rex